MSVCTSVCNLVPATKTFVGFHEMQYRCSAQKGVQQEWGS